MQLFYSQDLEGDRIELDPENARHAIKVLRSKVGDELHFTDGKGKLILARIVELGSKSCVIETISSELRAQRTPQLTLVVAPTKNIARFEWVLEKATEIGAERIVPIICARSERKAIKPERLEKILVSAMKQSQRAWLPELSEALSFKAFMDHEITGKGYIGWMDEAEPAHLKDALQPKKDATILIGPEGDFTPGEVEMAKAKGFQPISLGPSRLRTETAAIVACHTFALYTLK